MLKKILKEAELFISIYTSFLPDEQKAILLLGNKSNYQFKNLYYILDIDIFEESHCPQFHSCKTIYKDILHNLEEYKALAELEEDEEE